MTFVLANIWEMPFWSEPGPLGLPNGVVVFAFLCIWMLKSNSKENEKVAQEGREEREQQQKRVTLEAWKREERVARGMEAAREKQAAAESVISIHNAACDGNIEVVKKRLAAGTDVNAKNGDGRTPLDMAVFFKKSDIADLLRKHGGKTGEELKAEGK